MKRILTASLATLILAACSDTPTAPAPADPEPSLSLFSSDVLVTNSNDSGNGSFRTAIAQASANTTIEKITFLPSVSTINLSSGITFSGTQDLTINGNIATINGAGAGGTAFSVTGGGDLTLVSLTFQNAPGEGVAVEVPGSATGTIKVSLYNVAAIGNKGHGVLINDQVDPSTQDGVQPNPNGSAASLEVLVVLSRFVSNGFSVSDRDGLRVNEGGIGDLKFAMHLSQGLKNGADGTELDERGTGDVHVDISTTLFNENGVFDPADLDDGLDVDEYNDGGIFGKIVSTTALKNFEEGFDINENNAGDLRLNLFLVAANHNGEEGIDLEEDDDFGTAGDPNGGGGDLVTVMDGITTIGNGDAADGALKIREKEDGNLDVTLSNIISTDNIGSGIFARESSTGSSVVRIDKAFSSGNKAGTLDPFSRGHGIELLESGAGDLTGTVSRSTASRNAGNGIFGDETGAGAGTVTLTALILTDNVLGPTGGTATFLP
jgi:hypothetical protein